MNRVRLSARLLGIVLAASTAFVLDTSVRAQDATPALQEPEFVDHAFLLGGDGKLVELDHKDLTYRRETRARPFQPATATGRFIVSGTASPVRLPPNAHFIVKVPEGFDPKTIVSLKPFVVEKQLRSIPLVTAKQGFWGGVKSSEVPDTSVAVTFKKYGKGSYEIIAAGPLAPGEYAIEITGKPELGVFCFGVDAK